MAYQHIKIPAGEKITVSPDGSLNVPNHPIIPYIEGDGTGVDITPVMKAVVDAADTPATNVSIAARPTPSTDDIRLLADFTRTPLRHAAELSD